MKRNLNLVILLLLIVTAARYSPAAVNPSLPDSSHLELLLKKLTVVGNVLYVGAHPDDENTAALAYLSWGRLLRTGYLALNRGEGGQNLIGPEQGALLGVIRTQELLAARNIDNAEQFFTRAVDFGFSKSPDESFAKWGKDAVLSDVVWIVRNFRPDVIITRFPKEGGGHGHHTASAILAEEAFTAAADPNRFPEQLKYVKPWQAKRIVWNRFSWGNQPPLSDAEKASMPAMDLGEYNSLLAKAYTELAGISRDNHKSQGFGDSEDRGSFIEYFRNTAGEPAKSDLFEGIDLSWKRVPNSEKIAEALDSAYKSFKPEDPASTIPQLLKADALMKAHSPDPWITQKMEDVQKAIQACGGLWLEAIADDYSAVPGGQVKVKVTAINRSSFPFRLKPQTELPYNKPVTNEVAITIPDKQDYSQPYWLQSDNDKPFAVVKDQQIIGRPQSPPPVETDIHVMADQQELVFKLPVLYRWVDPVQGERYRRVVVVPEVALTLREPVLMFADGGLKNVEVELRSGKDAVSGEVHLRVPYAWKPNPVSIPFQLAKKGQTQIVQFTVTPGADAASGNYSAEAIVGGKKISRGLITIDYPHIPPQTLFPESRGKLRRLDLKKNGESIGYVVGSGDQMPEALSQVGYRVTNLSDDYLASGDLTRFDTILVGIRAYNTRTSLKTAQPRMLDYVKQGGTVVVQYNTLQDLLDVDIGPYPFKISRDRVSVEEAPITILRADHPLLNTPNKITQKDFDGWIQERGLYFPDQWDSNYETVIACNDPGESAKSGGILYAHYGKGIFIYTGYSWFRELPAGVPGAYRLFVNMLSARGSGE
jgi:LmbE family N-acetylglucosaminyl deacetylase